MYYYINKILKYDAPGLDTSYSLIGSTVFKKGLDKKFNIFNIWRNFKIKSIISEINWQVIVWNSFLSPEEANQKPMFFTSIERPRFSQIELYSSLHQVTCFFSMPSTPQCYPSYTVLKSDLWLWNSFVIISCPQAHRYFRYASHLPQHLYFTFGCIYLFMCWSNASLPKHSWYITLSSILLISLTSPTFLLPNRFELNG